MPVVLLIALFGVAGVLLRYCVDLLLSDVFSPFPTSTFLINVVGSFLIGVVYVASMESGAISRNLSIALSVGLLGGFTTFSAYGLQTMLLAKGGNLPVAVLYFVLSPVVAVLGVFAGLIFGRAIT